MIRNNTYIKRKVAGNHVLIPTGSSLKKMNGIIQLNPTAALIWDLLGNEISRESLIQTLVEIYDRKPEDLNHDICSFLLKLSEMDLMHD